MYLLRDICGKDVIDCAREATESLAAAAEPNWVIAMRIQVAARKPPFLALTDYFKFTDDTFPVPTASCAVGAESRGLRCFRWVTRRRC